jgi:hypothetical protein
MGHICRFYWVILFCGFLSICASSLSHKFYISKTTIEFNARTQQFEITCKMFTDDLELAVERASGKSMLLGTERELSETNTLLESYMKQHFKCAMDGGVVEWRWVGKEVENDLTYCYMEIYRKPDFASLTVTNDILISEFPDQQNIVDLTVSGSTQTLLFIKDRIQQTFLR